MVVVFCCVLFRAWNDIWIVWCSMNGWQEVDLTPGKELSFRIYTGPCDVNAMKKFEYLKSIPEVGIPNSDGVSMSVKKVEMIIKERDLEYNLEFCDIFVTGVIL